MTINEAAALTGLSADTLRYYERIGIIPRVPRLPNGWRDYDAEAMRRINLALRLKAAGMPLKTVKRYIALDAAGEPARGERTRLLLETCEALDEKLKNLQNSLRLARELLNEEAAPRGESCAAA